MDEQNLTEQIATIERLFKLKGRFERFARLNIHDAAAQDIVMESYAYVWERRGEIDLSGNIEAYMYNVIKHKSLDLLDRRLTRQVAENQLKSDARWQLEMDMATLRAFEPGWLYDGEIRRKVREALDRLPAKTRRIFIASRVEGRTYAQIAAVEGVGVKSVEFHIGKALRQLRVELGDYFVLLLILLV